MSNTSKLIIVAALLFWVNVVGACSFGENTVCTTLGCNCWVYTVKLCEKDYREHIKEQLEQQSAEVVRDMEG
jgi:hypothetical protein